MNDLSQVSVSPLAIGLTEFIDEFGDELLDSLNRSNPPVYSGSINEAHQRVMSELKRQPFPAQADVVQAVAALLLDRNEQAAVINAEMGTGKTMMAIAVAAVMHSAGYRRTLVVSPPHRSRRALKTRNRKSSFRPTLACAWARWFRTSRCLTLRLICPHTSRTKY